jgi:hypothetical protein
MGERVLKKKLCYSLSAVLLITMFGCGDGSSSSSGGGSGKTYYVVKYTNGYVTLTNGPFSSLNSCQEFLASPSGHAAGYVGATCIESATRPY